MFYSSWRMVSFLIFGYPVSAFERKFPPHTSKNLFKIPNQNITTSTVPKGSVYCFKFKIWFYLVHLQQLKGMQSSKQGMWKGHHFSKEKWYVKAGKGNRVGPRGGASLYKSLLSAPRFYNTYSKHFTIFITNCIIYTGTRKLKTNLGLPSSSETKSKHFSPFGTWFKIFILCTPPERKQSPIFRNSK